MARHAMRRSAIAAVAAVAGASAMSLWLAGGVGSAAQAPSAPHAEAAARRRSLIVNDTVRFSLVRKDGNVVYERGTATGTFPGTVTARFVTTLTRVTGSVTFLPYSGGSITLTAVGYPQSLSKITGLTGTMAVRSGTGKYSRALGTGSFTGTANRRTWAVTVNARANLTY